MRKCSGWDEGRLMGGLFFGPDAGEWMGGRRVGTDGR